jgi:hypothetical protein
MVGFFCDVSVSFVGLACSLLPRIFVVSFSVISRRMTSADGVVPFEPGRESKGSVWL